MDHLIGKRFNLISKSEIRYVGTLHEINPEQSTIALEDVYSFGTEGRKVGESFIPPSQTKFDYIVFRGSDVKDIKIAEEQSDAKQPSPPSMPNDPAILNSSRLGPPSQGPPHNRDQSTFPPPGYPPHLQFGGYYPPQQQYGRGFGPPPPGSFGPGPGFPNMPPYGPPPPGYYGPPPGQGQGFPEGPPNQFAPPPIGPPGQRGPPGQQPQPLQNAPKPTSELPVDNKAAPISQSATPAPPVLAAPPAGEEKPTVSDATATSTAPPTMAAVAAKTAPVASWSNRVAPAVPMTVNQKSFIPPPTANGPLSNTTGNQSSTKAAPSAAAMEEASRQAKEAVAAAMAKLNPGVTTKPNDPSNHAMDALTKKVGEMRTDIPPGRGRGGFRGRGAFRGGSGGQPTKKMEIPKDDYDFESANAKFNKEDLVKEAIAGSPLGDNREDANGTPEVSPTNGRKDSNPTIQAYNKTSSFFDNISSEIKDRQEAQEERFNGRQLRSEEFKKNMDTFGQGNVDNGGYRGRGRGRGYRGGFQRGFNRGYAGGGGGGFRGRGATANVPAS